MAARSAGPPERPSPTSLPGARVLPSARVLPTSPAVVDAAVAVGVAVVSLVALAISNEPGARAADAGAYALLVAASAPLAFRARSPLVVLGAVAVVTLLSFVLGYPGGPVTIPLLAGIYGAAAAGHRRWSWVAVGVFAGAGAVVRTFVENEPLVSVALNSALFVLVVLLGDVVYSRRALRTEVQERLRRAEAEREREAQRRVIAERMHIARELHDVMAHTIASMTVQAGVAADSLDGSPDEARTALRTIRESARQAMKELRATVSVLREGDQPTPLLPAPGLDELPALLDAVTKEGLQVDLHGTARRPPLPAAVDVTAYRIVQEALTNVMRHAGATRVTITVADTDGEVVLTVDDDGRGAQGPAEPGFGLQGMRERAEAVGGRLTAGTRAGGGYRVRAHLPRGGSDG